MTFAAPFGLAEPIDDERRTIPFDYAFRFELDGKPGETHTDKITVSIEAAFTAVSVGYGLVAKALPLRFGPRQEAVVLAVSAGAVGTLPTTLEQISFGDLIAALDGLTTDQRDQIFSSGFRLTPGFAELALRDDGASTVPAGVMSELFQAVAVPTEQIQFTYALFDDGSGREFQSAPILNTAGRGTADGERPFHYFARPITFTPHSVIRMEVSELSTVPSDLYVSLHGYKILGGNGTPTGRQPSRRARRR
jgi:hypothetical protein